MLLKRSISFQQDPAGRGPQAGAASTGVCWRHLQAAGQPQGVASLAAAQIPSIQEDADKWAPVLKRICWYLVLAPADSDQVTLLNHHGGRQEAGGAARVQGAAADAPS